MRVTAQLKLVPKYREEWLMAEVRTALTPFVARQWNSAEHEKFEIGDRVIALRHESGYSIFAREADPVRRYLLTINDFRAATKGLNSPLAGQID